ncbi:MAG: Rrf2 family transcriptional regulator [Candidatus Melainabacteria bacterium]|nr:Rrf2 family transcriptional regulator [Candidatus Melainabacteria bacterium]
MFSQSVDYALRATVCLAMNPGKVLTTEFIALTTKVPAPYLAKIIKSLSRVGIIASQRGVKGGSRLAKSANDISVLDVMNAVDPMKRIDYCPLNLPNHGINLCPMHHKLNDAITVVERVLSESSIQQLISEKTQSIPMCGESLHSI